MKKEYRLNAIRFHVSIVLSSCAIAKTFHDLLKVHEQDEHRQRLDRVEKAYKEANNELRMEKPSLLKIERIIKELHDAEGEEIETFIK